jgi:hypothetical protein
VPVLRSYVAASPLITRHFDARKDSPAGVFRIEAG